MNKEHWNCQMGGYLQKNVFSLLNLFKNLILNRNNKKHIVGIKIYKSNFKIIIERSIREKIKAYYYKILYHV